VTIDLLVVGAGPAGVAAGLTAKARGLDVVVVDKATFPRDKTCGDGLTAQALRLLERLGVDVPDVADALRVEETILVSPSGRRVALPLPDEGIHSAVVPRLELDHALVTRARAAGVDVREATEIEALTELDGRVRATLAGEQIEARFVVAADGHWSAVRRLQRPERPADLGTWHAFRQYFAGVDDARQWVVFEEDLLPGYAWVFPLPRGRANVGFGILRGPGVTGKRLKALWDDLLARPALAAILGPRATPEGSHRAWPIPAAFDADALVDGRVLYVGDAAGVVDPLTGEGIAQALETGTLAAEAVARGGAHPTVTARYRSSVERAVGRDVRFAANLQRLLRRPLGARAAIRAADLTPWTRRNFARWMFEDYPRAALFTPQRWRPGLFRARGAYARTAAGTRS
jgi:menaquinone-9 beta-reductase